jgi:hypothetical protein
MRSKWQQRAATMMATAVLALAVLAGPAGLEAQAATTTEPGVTAAVGLSPATASAPGTVTTTRTVTLTNANLDATTTSTFNLGIKVGVTPTGVPVPVDAIFISTVTVLGARNGRLLTMLVPTGTVFVLASLKLNGVAQADPTISAGSYTVTLNLPAAANASTPSVTTVLDKVQVTTPNP